MITSSYTGKRAVKAATVLLVAGAGVAVYAQSKGPSSSQSAYLLPTVPLVKTTAVLTTGDSIGGYRMVGIPDGLGAFDNGDGTLTLLMNHELQNNQGIARAHGSIGALVSKWIIEKSTMHVISGGDLIQQVFLWNATTQSSNPTSSPFAFHRFCSGDLPDVSAFYDGGTGLGTQQRIYMHGEEGANGHQQATVVTGPDAGKSYELGKFNLTTNHPGGGAPTGVGSWENALANPYPQVHTFVIGNSDGGTGIMTNALAVYWGTKQSSGTEVDKAGLTNGTLKFVNVTGNAVEIVNSTNRTTNITSGTRFSLSASSSTTFSRPEDGQWNPFNPAEFYFVTTDQLDQVTDGTGAQIGRTRLWRLTFDDVTNPDLGGKIDLLIDGRVVDGVRVNMFDNLTVNRKTGQLLLQEDVGSTPHNGKVWLYDPATDELRIVVKHDPARFGDLGPIAATPPFTNDEESSGVIDMSHILGLGYYLTVDQAHYPINTTTPNGFSNPNELVEGGQLLLAYIPFPVVENKDQCKDSGWQGRFRANGTTFKNQGDCVSYTNTGK